MTPVHRVAVDANGNTLSDASGKQYTWDFENRLTQAVVPGANGGTTTFKYDPFGRRIQKISPSFTSAFLYDGANLIETVNASGAEVASYTQTKEIDETLAELRGSSTDYYLADGLGSITSLSASSGTLANTYSYDSFGNLTASSGTIRNYFQYTGREFDPETGIYEYRARYFDPTIGRFISEDPIGLNGGINFYRYVMNQPVNNFDAFGLQCTTRVMLVTAYCSTGRPTKSGVWPGSGTVAVANTHPQPYPMGCSVSVSGPLGGPLGDPRPLDPFNTPSYVGTVQDTGAGWNPHYHNVPPWDWIDIFFPGSRSECRRQANAWGLQWRQVTICCKDKDCPNAK